MRNLQVGEASPSSCDLTSRRPRVLALPVGDVPLRSRSTDAGSFHLVRLWVRVTAGNKPVLASKYLGSDNTYYLQNSTWHRRILTTVHCREGWMIFGVCYGKRCICHAGCNVNILNLPSHRSLCCGADVQTVSMNIAILFGAKEYNAKI